MPSIRSYHRAFEPNDIEAMSLAYEGSLQRPSHQWRRQGSRDHREKVIELARRGERCPTVLRDRVLAEANAGI